MLRHTRHHARYVSSRAAAHGRDGVQGADGLMTRVGPIGRLGRYTATHFRVVLIAWLLVAVVLGFFAPRVETALSGAGWEATGSQSVQARQLIDRNFHGLSAYGLLTVISSPTETLSDPSFRAAITGVERTLRADGAVSTRGRADRRRVDLS